MCVSVSVWVTAAHSAHYLFAYQDNQHLLSVIIFDTHSLDLSSEVLMNISSLAEFLYIFRYWELLLIELKLG